MRLILLVISMSVITACSTDGAENNNDEILACVDVPTSVCAPLYAPTYDEFFAKTAKGCAGNDSCHTTKGARGGLILDNKEQAYDMLLNSTNGEPRVIPGDPECSLLVKRLLADDPAKAMPPGKPLGDPEKCAIVEWIRSGAKK